MEVATIRARKTHAYKMALELLTPMLVGRMNADFFDRKAAEWRGEQDRLLRSIEMHQAANQNYLEEGVQLLELTQRAHGLFQRQESREKRRLLNFLLSNGSWKDRKLTVVFKQPFDMLVNTNNVLKQQQESITPTPVDFENWLPGQDSNLQHFG